MAHIECICPPRADGTPRHPDGDDVTLRPTLDFTAARACYWASILAINEGADGPEMLAVLTAQYLLHGVVGWTVVDADGHAVEPTKKAIREYLLADITAAGAVGTEADILYSEEVIPLVMQASDSSQPSPTTGSTSATNTAGTPDTSPSPTSGATSSAPVKSNGASRTRRPKHSKRSSTTTSPMDGTEPTYPLHVGVSSYSQS